MNVYQKEYHPEFIKELPVDFNKMKNMDLNTIPTKYHKLFTTDWNWGRYSSMDMERRSILQELFMEYNHDDTRAMINLKSKIEETPSVGFVEI